MTLQFPASPTLNQTFTASNNLIYKWDGEKWITLGSSATDTTKFVRNDIDNTYAGLISATGSEAFGVPVGTTAEQPANADGLLRYNSTLDRYEGSSNGSWGALGGGATGGGTAFKNQLINGGFNIWQRGASFTSNNTEYTADRWVVTTSSDTASTKERNRGSNAPVKIGAAIATSVSASSLCQGIELANQGKEGLFYSGSTWTLSLYTDNTNMADNPALIRFSDDAQGATNSSTIFTTPSTWTKIADADANGYTRYSLTFNVDQTPNSSNLCLSIKIRLGSVIGGATKVSGVQLEPGPVATPFEHRPIATELALCERYYQQATGVVYTMAVSRTTEVLERSLNYSFGTTMRTLPTLNVILNSAASAISATAYVDGFDVKADADVDSRILSLRSFNADAEL